MTAGSSYASNENKNRVNMCIKNEWKKKRAETESLFCTSRLQAVSYLSERKKKREKYTRNVRRFPRVACPSSFSRVGEYFAVLLL